MVASATAAALTVLFFVTDGVAQQVVYHCVSGASAVTILVGVRLHRPARRTPWYLLAAGLATMTVADVVGDLVRAGAEVPSAAPALLYLIAWLLVAQAVRGFARARVPGGDRDALLDAVAVVVAVGLVLWGVILDPALREQGLGAVPAASLAVFPVAQAGLLALYLRLLFAGGSRLWSAWVLCVGGGVGGLLGSSAYVLLAATGEYHAGAWNNVFWLLAYAAPGVAALCPDMRRLTAPARPGAPLSTPRWLVLAAALIATTATACFSATHVDDLQLFAVAIPVPLVVLWRLRRVLVDKDAAVARAEEQAARHALVAEIGRRAIADGAGDDLVLDACARLGSALGVPVQVVDARPAGTTDLGGSGTVDGTDVTVGIGGTADSQRWLHLGTPRGGWSPSDLALTHSIANVLVAASVRHEHDEQVRWSAGHDPLTGLANRRELMSRLHAALADPGTAPVGLIFLDLDGFKQVNDTLGHAAGDALLVEVARRLEAAVRDDDHVARLAGDEFVVLCAPSRLGGSADPVQVAARVQQALRPPVEHAGRTLRISASIGVAVHRPGQSADELLRSADALMYADKAHAPRRAAAR